MDIPVRNVGGKGSFCFIEKSSWPALNFRVSKVDYFASSFRFPILLFSLKNSKIKSHLHCTRGITLKRVTSNGAHLRDSAPGHHSFKETSQPLATLSDLTGPGIDLIKARIAWSLINHLDSIVPSLQYEAVPSTLI